MEITIRGWRCPNCGYTEPSRIFLWCEFFVGIVLYLFFCIPGIIYGLCISKIERKKMLFPKICPRCKVARLIREDLYYSGGTLQQQWKMPIHDETAINEKICSKCGARNTMDSRFCENCGKPL
jgi:ribosomal protein L40E